jgi:hypothetical protein
MTLPEDNPDWARDAGTAAGQTEFDRQAAGAGQLPLIQQETRIRPITPGSNAARPAEDTGTEAEADEVDLQALARAVYRLLMQELRLERERST